MARTDEVLKALFAFLFPSRRPAPPALPSAPCPLAAFIPPHYFCFTCCSSPWEDAGPSIRRIPAARRCPGYAGASRSSWVSPPAPLWSRGPRESGCPRETGSALGRKPGRKQSIPFPPKPAAALPGCGVAFTRGRCPRLRPWWKPRARRGRKGQGRLTIQDLQAVTPSGSASSHQEAGILGSSSHSWYLCV